MVRTLSMRTLSMVLGAWLLLIAPAQAVDPLMYTRSTLEQARTIVVDSQAHDQKLAALSALFGKFLDTDVMGREALGPHWSSFTPAQQKEFLGLFRKLMQRTCVEQLLLFENPDFVYAGEQHTGAGAIVYIKIVTPRDQFHVNYQLRPKGDTWQATAITVESVNLTENLGAQFNHLLSRMSVDDLLALMRQKYGAGSGVVTS
jgi:phospholipid transport system substrate-binding protein